MEEKLDPFSEDLLSLENYINNYFAERPHLADYELYQFFLKPKGMEIDHSNVILPEDEVFKSKRLDEMNLESFGAGARCCISQSTGLRYRVFGSCHGGDSPCR